MHAEQGRYHDWRDLFSGGVTAGEGFTSGVAPDHRGNSKHGKAESRRWQICIDERSLGVK